MGLCRLIRQEAACLSSGAVESCLSLAAVVVLVVCCRHHHRLLGKLDCKGVGLGRGDDVGLPADRTVMSVMCFIKFLSGWLKLFISAVLCHVCDEVTA